MIYGKKPVEWLGEKDELGVAIPDTFFKIVIREAQDDSLEVLALLYPQTGRWVSRQESRPHALLDECECDRGIHGTGFPNRSS